MNKRCLTLVTMMFLGCQIQCGRYDSDLIPPPPGSDSPDEGAVPPSPSHEHQAGDQPNGTSGAELPKNPVPGSSGEVGAGVGGSACSKSGGSSLSQSSLMYQSLIDAVTSANLKALKEAARQNQLADPELRVDPLHVLSKDGLNLLQLAIKTERIELVQEVLKLWPALNPFFQLQHAAGADAGEIKFLLTGDQPDVGILNQSLFQIIEESGPLAYLNQKWTGLGEKYVKRAKNKLDQGGEADALLAFKVDDTTYALSALELAMGLELDESNKPTLRNRPPHFEMAALLVCHGADLNHRFPIFFRDEFLLVSVHEWASALTDVRPSRATLRLARRLRSLMEGDTPYMVEDWLALLDPNKSINDKKACS